MIQYIYNHVGELIAGITALLLIVQLELARKAFKADHERRKKQATVEFVSRLRDSSWPLEITLRSKFGDNVINNGEIDGKEEITIGRFLSLVEQLATGVNVGVFDYDVVSRMIGYHLTSMYDKLHPFIDKSRGNKTNNYSHEYEVLRNRILRDRTTEIKEGNIKYS